MDSSQTLGKKTAPLLPGVGVCGPSLPFPMLAKDLDPRVKISYVCPPKEMVLFRTEAEKAKPTVSDVAQARSNCFFAAAVAAVAASNPVVITKTIKENPDLSIEVLFQGSTKKVRIDRRFVAYDAMSFLKFQVGLDQDSANFNIESGNMSSQMFSDHFANGTYWYAALEKAWLMHENLPYLGKIPGGSPARQLQLLTGKSASDHIIKDKFLSEDEFFSFLHNHFHERHGPIVLSTAEKLPTTFDHKQLFNTYNISENHAYAVIHVQMTGARYLLIKSPWLMSRPIQIPPDLAFEVFRFVSF